MTRLVVSIVLYRPQGSLLIRTLETLAAAMHHAAAHAGLTAGKIVLTDNSVVPQDEALLSACRLRCASREMDLGLEYDFVGENLGFGRANNRAFERHGKDSAFFLVANPDLEFFEDSLSEGLAFLLSCPDKGLLAAAAMEDGDELTPACFRYPDCLTLSLRLLCPGSFPARNARYECRDWDPDQFQANPPVISGCCMLFRTASFEALGGFDPGYFLYFEDFDLSYRAGRAGLSAYAPGLRVRHHGGGAGRKGLKHIRWFAASAWRFFSTHGWSWV